MNKLGIFMNFWEKNWDADHAKYIRKAKEIGFDILEFQAQPLLEMSDDKIRSLKALADEAGIELTYSLGLDRAYDVSSVNESIRQGGVEYLQNIIKKHGAYACNIIGERYDTGAKFGLIKAILDEALFHDEVKEEVQVEEDSAIEEKAEEI